jgi:hypothetical protein
MQYSIRLVCCRFVINFSQNRLNHFALKMFQDKVLPGRWERVSSVSGKRSFGTAGIWWTLRAILFYRRLNGVLEQAGFDEFCEARCRKFYHEKLGRPSLPPGIYFRVMLIGFFEGIESERGIAWRVADSLSLRGFLRMGLDEGTPDHVTISRTRRLLDEATHQEIFGWVLRQVTRTGLLKGMKQRCGAWTGGARKRGAMRNG